MEGMQNKPKVEKISLKELKAEEQKQTFERVENEYDELKKAFLELTPEEQKQVFNHK